MSELLSSPEQTHDYETLQNAAVRNWQRLEQQLPERPATQQAVFLGLDHVIKPDSPDQKFAETYLDYTDLDTLMGFPPDSLDTLTWNKKDEYVRLGFALDYYNPEEPPPENFSYLALVPQPEYPPSEHFGVLRHEANHRSILRITLTPKEFADMTVVSVIDVMHR